MKEILLDKEELAQEKEIEKVQQQKRLDHVAQDHQHRDLNQTEPCQQTIRERSPFPQQELDPQENGDPPQGIEKLNHAANVSRKAF